MPCFWALFASSVCTFGESVSPGALVAPRVLFCIAFAIISGGCAAVFFAPMDSTGSIFCVLALHGGAPCFTLRSFSRLFEQYVKIGGATYG